MQILPVDRIALLTNARFAKFLIFILDQLEYYI